MREAGAIVYGPIVYGLCLLASLVALAVALVQLVGGSGMPPAVTPPVGLPWLGAPFRIDMLAAFFLVVVNLGAAAAFLFALGYGRPRVSPETVLPLSPAFLAALKLGGVRE